MENSKLGEVARHLRGRTAFPGGLAAACPIALVLGMGSLKEHQVPAVLRGWEHRSKTSSAEQSPVWPTMGWKKPRGFPGAGDSPRALRAQWEEGTKGTQGQQCSPGIGDFVGKEQEEGTSQSSRQPGPLSGARPVRTSQIPMMAEAWFWTQNQNLNCSGLVTGSGQVLTLSVPPFCQTEQQPSLGPPWVRE